MSEDDPETFVEEPLAQDTSKPEAADDDEAGITKEEEALPEDPKKSQEVDPAEELIGSVAKAKRFPMKSTSFSFLGGELYFMGWFPS